jgi:hypothetical protein
MGKAYLEVTKLSKLLSTGVEETGEWFCLHVGDLMGADVTPLGEALVADFAFEGLFPCVSALMGLDRERVSMIRSSKDKDSEDKDRRVLSFLSCMGLSSQMLCLP